MAGGAIVGALKYLVEVDSERAAVEIDKFLAEAKAKVDAAGGDAVFRMLGDKAQLDKDIAQAQADVDRLSAKNAVVEFDGDTGKLMAALETAKREVQEATHKKAVFEFETRGINKVLAEMGAVQALKEKMTKTSGDNVAATDKEALAVAKLRESYNKLASERLKLQRATRPGNQFGTEGERLALARVNAEMRQMEHEGQRLGAGLEHITQDVEGSRGGFVNWARNIGDTRVNMLAFSGTVKSMSIALGGLAPIIAGLVGSLSALVGAVGAGLVGAFGIGAGALTGFGLAAIGAGIALHQPIHQLGIAHKATTQYADAVQKYGKNSKQAQAKQAQMNSALKGLPRSAQQAMKSLGDMRVQFMKLGGTSIRNDFFTSFAKGIKTAQALLPTFAKGSASVFHQASQGFNDWMKGLRGGEAQGILHNLFSNASKDIGPLMAGLGSLGTAFGRFISLASNAGPGISTTFKNWAQGIADATGKGSGFGATVDSLVSKAKSLGSFLSATGRLAIAFFGAGADSGQRMLDTMTKAENRWTSWMKSAAGQNSLHQFFSDAVDNTTQLFRALAPLARTITALSAAFLPLTTGILKGATYIGDFVHFLTQIPGLLPAIHGLGVGLAGIFVATKIRAYVGIFQSFLRFIGVMAAEETAATAATAANTAAVEANTAALAANAGAAEASGAAHLAMGGEAAAGEAALVGVDGAALSAAGGMGAAEGAAGGLAVGLAPVAVTIGAIVGGGLLLNHFFGDAGNRWQPAIDASKAFNAAAAQIPVTQKQVQQSMTKSNSLWERVAKLTKAGKTGTQAYTTAVRGAAKADTAHAEAQQRSRFEITKARTAVQTTASQYDKAKKAVIDMVQSGLRPGNPALDTTITTMTSLGATLRLNTLNFNRLKAGAAAAGPAMLKSLNALKQIAGRQTALKFRFSDTAVTGQLAKVSQSLKSLGKTQAVKIALQGSATAEEALARLKNYLHSLPGEKKVKVTANDQASSKVSSIKSKIDALTDKYFRVAARDQSSPKLAAIQAAIDALHDKQVTITTTHLNRTINEQLTRGQRINHAGRYAGGVVPGFATGAALDRLMERAYARADRAPGLNPARGAQVRSPRYVVGEEPGRTEFIITDNPAYRRSNLAYLRDAMQALGVVPGFGKGGKRGKGKKGGKRGKRVAAAASGSSDYGASTFGLTLDDMIGPGTDYDHWEKEVSYLANVASLTQRNYDLGKTDLNSVIGAIGNEISAYRTLKGVIDGVVGSGATSPVKPKGSAPTKPKKLSKKDKQNKKKVAKFNRAMKQYERDKRAYDAAQQQAEEHNASIPTRSDLDDEARTINDITIPNLTLDILEAQNAAAQNANLGAASFNSARWDLLKSFGSNIGGLGGGSLFSQVSNAALTPGQVGFGSPSAAQLSSAVSARSAAPMRAASGSSGTVNNVTNNFAAPPPDPHTWAQQQSYELSAL